MESLERKLEQLSPEQQKSVEDYVDFLLHRSAQQAPAQADPAPTLPLISAAPPPFIAVPEIPGEDPPVVRITHGSPRSEPPQDTYEPDLPSARVLQEIAPEPEDSLTSGYMDYGRFEPAEKAPVSPADEAVRKVRIRLGEKKRDIPTNNLLEWID